MGKQSPRARALEHVALLSTGGPLDADLRVTLNFHPDRLVHGKPILKALAGDGTYRSQFETRTSNGGLTAYPGGDRWRWESRMFGEAYDHAPASERPKYGGLNFRRAATGAAPRFGSAHFRLSQASLKRTTFCFPDSVTDPVDFGTADNMSLLDKASVAGGASIDNYIEAQVHGQITLGRDVEALVLDPCFRATEIERLARELPCPLEWHSGFRLSTEEMSRHTEFRGTTIVHLGLLLAEGGHLDARIIGEAARNRPHQEQALKRVWHYVARFGAQTM